MKISTWMKISIIGAGGHVGVPFSLVCADAGHDVTGIDVDKERNLLLNSAIMPFKEEGALPLLRKYIERDTIRFVDTYKSLETADVIVVMIGTPVDGEGNPRLDDIFDVAERINYHKKKNRPTIILRSTVAPGTTELFRSRVGDVSAVYYIPERVVQGHGIEETKKHIWMVGTESTQGQLSEALLDLVTSIGVRIHTVTWKEAEIGKLMTNMYRYVNFAFANQMYMIGTKHGVDTHKIIQLFNEGYDRLNVPMPGPNVGGPCLFKDGKFLTIGFPFPELISTAFQINEGMPEFVLEQMLKKQPIQKLLILGATFKADSDDTRSSLSFKLAKVCKLKGIDVSFYDPNVSKYAVLPKYLDDYCAAVVMTPHKEFNKKFLLQLNVNIDLIYDPWNGDWWEAKDMV